MKRGPGLVTGIMLSVCTAVSIDVLMAGDLRTHGRDVAWTYGATQESGAELLPLDCFTEVGLLGKGRSLGYRPTRAEACGSGTTRQETLQPPANLPLLVAPEDAVPLICRLQK